MTEFRKTPLTRRTVLGAGLAGASLLAMPALYDGLRLAGAAYLVFLGIKALLKAWRSRGGAPADAPPRERQALRSALMPRNTR